MFYDERFTIEVLFWRTGSTAIHQHGFSGAFGLFAGSSLHAEYSFDTEEDQANQLQLGVVQLRRVELLRQGAVRPIGLGTCLIHSLFHLDAPTVSVVIRSSNEDSPAELVYSPPAVAFDPGAMSPLRYKQFQALELLLQVNRSLAKELCSTFVDSADLYTSFQLLLRVQQGTRDSVLFAEVLKMVEKKFPKEATKFAISLKEELRKVRMQRLRDSVTCSEHRFLLALLMTVPDRVSTLELIRDRLPGCDPTALVHIWVVSLFRSLPLGIDFDRSLEILLSLALSNESQESVVSALAGSLGKPLSAEEEASVIIAYNKITQNELLRPLFT
jgi:hypothetical protein